MGDRFLVAVENQLERIRDNPEMYAVLRSQIRAAPIRKFPYVVYYRIETDSIFVIAIQRGGRHPSSWHRRLDR